MSMGKGQNTSTAVMARRVEPPDSLDFFPTPPWATRAFCVWVLPILTCGTDLSELVAWDPCAGEGHMSEVLKEYFHQVYASDVHDYGKGYEVGSFVGDGLAIASSRQVDWLIFNPPFNLAQAFINRALNESRSGVAVLVRTSFLEGVDRYNKVYHRNPPTLIAQYVERVPMKKGVWDPNGTTASSYCWLVWGHETKRLPFMWIPPGCRKELTKPDDAERFSPDSVAPLFDRPAEEGA